MSDVKFVRASTIMPVPAAPHKVVVDRIGDRDYVQYFVYCPNCRGRVMAHNEPGKQERCEDCKRLFIVPRVPEHLVPDKPRWVI